MPYGNLEHIWRIELFSIGLQPLQQYQPNSATEHRATASSLLQCCLGTGLENVKSLLIAALVELFKLWYQRKQLSEVDTEKAVLVFL